MICRDVCACTRMLWMCVLYVSFGSKVRLSCRLTIALVAEWQRVRLRVRMVKVRLSLWAIF